MQPSAEVRALLEKPSDRLRVQDLAAATSRARRDREALVLALHHLPGLPGVTSCETMKFLHLNFLPRSTDAALLVLRIWFGASMLGLHGWDKMAKFSSMAPMFVDPLGIGKTASLALAVAGEVGCAAFLVLGLFTRVAAIGAACTMAVAFWFAHGARLKGPGNGEMAFLYLGVFVVLFLAGAGKFSVDAKIGAKS